jgi:hypothetical protein
MFQKVLQTFADDDRGASQVVGNIVVAGLAVVAASSIGVTALALAGSEVEATRATLQMFEGMLDAAL